MPAPPAVAGGDPVRPRGTTAGAMTPDPEAGARAIVDAARARRPATPRWLWILAAVIGGACAIAFGVVLLVTGEAVPGPAAPAPVAAGGRGFGAGMVVGVIVGVIVGLGVGRALARQRRSHSARSSP